MSAPGRRPPTMADVAARVGLSKALVSLVFRGAPGASEQTRVRVMQAAEEIGYRSNRTASLLARKRTRLLGVPVHLQDAFQAELAEQVQVAADEQGYTVVLGAVTPAWDEGRVVDALLELRCEALVLLAPDLRDEELAVLGAQVPVVVVGRRTRAPEVDVVRTADHEGVAQAVEHLVALGHTSIVHVDGGRAPMAVDRRRGYRESMRRRGLGGQVRVLRGGYREEDGARAAALLLRSGRLPTAVVTANDRSALGVLDVFLRAGTHVPGDVSVVGYDDSALSRLAHIGLTTVTQEAALQATRAVACAVERLDGGRSVPREVVLHPRLVERTTTAPVRPG